MSQKMPQEFWQSIEQFNAGQFYACHDTLEALWMEASEPERNLYQGILQIAVALYHLGNENLRGAIILLGEGCSRLRKYPSNYCGLEIAEFLAHSLDLLHELQQLETDKNASTGGRKYQNLPIQKIVIVDTI